LFGPVFTGRIPAAVRPTIANKGCKTMTTKLSAAEQYARLKADRFESFIESSFSSEALKDTDLFEVKTPSGMTF
jgi:hypothetical protein